MTNEELQTAIDCAIYNATKHPEADAVGLKLHGHLCALLDEQRHRAAKGEGAMRDTTLTVKGMGDE